MNAKPALAACLVALFAGSMAAPVAARSPVEPGKRQCFYTGAVSNFTAADDHTLYVRVGVRDVYQFEMLGPCPDMRWSERLALVAKPSPWICSGMDADVVTPSSIGPQRCAVRSLRKLTPAEVAALPRKARP